MCTSYTLTVQPNLGACGIYCGNSMLAWNEMNHNCYCPTDNCYNRAPAVNISVYRLSNVSISIALHPICSSFIIQLCICSKIVVRINIALLR